MKSITPLPAQLLRRIGLDRQGVLYGLQLALTAWVAFAVASFLHIPNPFWAAMPVFVVAQSTRGLAFERGLYRVIGTGLGALAGFGMIQFVASAPYLTFALLAIWVGVAGGLSHLIYGVRSYAALMAGVTAVVVVVPCLFAPENYMYLAAARVECTFIGVVLITLSSALLTPRADKARFYRALHDVSRSACHLLGSTLCGTVSEGAKQEADILEKVSQLETASVAILAGSKSAGRQRRIVNAVIVSTVGLVACSRRLHHRQPPGFDAADMLGKRLLALSADSSLAAPAALEKIRESIVLAEQTDAMLALHLNRMFTAIRSLLQDDGQAPKSFARSELPLLAPSADWGLARQTALLCGAITLASTSLAYLGGSFLGEMTALGTAMFSLILGSMIKPQLIAPFLLQGILAGSIIAIGYRLAIFPHIQSTWLVVVSLLPFMLVGGLARASLKFRFPALDANMAFLLASQAMLPAREVTAIDVVAESATIALAACIVAGGFILLPRRSDRHVHDASHRIHRDLLQLIRSNAKRPMSQDQWLARTIRQTLRLTAHIAQTRQRHNLSPAHMIAALNFGHSICRLQAQEGQWTKETRETLKSLPRELEAFSQSPDALAARLMDYATELRQREVALLLHDAATALIAGREFFSFRRNMAATGSKGTE